MLVLANLPPKAQNEIKRKAENYAKDKGEKEIYVQTVFNAKPDIK